MFRKNIQEILNDYFQREFDQIKEKLNPTVTRGDELIKEIIVQKQSEIKSLKESPIMEILVLYLVSKLTCPTPLPQLLY